MFRSVPHRLAAFEHQVLPRVVAPLLGALLIIAASQHVARAAQDGVFVISDTEGYGVMDCLVEGKSCGRIVADAWCEAHGYAAARSFGPASDVTASTPASTKAATRIAPGAVIVACNP